MEFEKVDQDKRGKIYLVLDDGKKAFKILTTNKGFARGGCIHTSNKELCVAIKGKVIFYIRGEKPRVFKKGDMLRITANSPHYYVAEEDSMLLECGVTWEETKKDKEFRNIVNEINSSK